MPRVLQILFGAAFTIAASLCLGRLLLDRLRVSLYREEAVLLAFVSGSALLSQAVFVLSLVHQARRNIFLVGGVAVMLLAWREARGRPPRKSFTAIPRTWKIIFILIFTAFFLLYFLNALAPETSPDGSGYHLGNVLRMWRRRGFVWNYHSMYSYLSQGMEMVFLVAFSIGRHSSATLVHFAFQFAMPLLIFTYGRRFGFSNVSLFAAVLVYSSPVAGKAGASAYNDLA